MSKIQTQRLLIKPTHPHVWSILDRQDQQLIGKLFFRAGWFNILLKPQSLHLGVASEASHGLLSALNQPTYHAKTDQPHAQQFLLDLGFEPHGKHYRLQTQHLKSPAPYAQLNQQLGIDTDQLTQPVHATSCQLVSAGSDCFDRPARLHPKAWQAWQNLVQAASDDGIELQMVSAFRSLRYQAALVQKKLSEGQSLEQVLSVNAAPGHSEHHTGCAVDITTPGSDPLEESFAQTAAFAWLQDHAGHHGFAMTYPQDNAAGMVYEPWHWRHHINKTAP